MNDPAINYFVDQFQTLQKELKEDRLQEKRLNAISGLQKTGLPTLRHENWKYTDIRPITRKQFELPPDTQEKFTKASLDKVRLQEPDCHELVLINGRFSTKFSRIGSLPEGVIIQDLASAIGDHYELIEDFFTENKDPDAGFNLLNTAFIRDGIFIFVPENIVIDKPVNLLYLSGLNDQPFASHPRNLITLSENSQLTVIESYIGIDESDYFTNTVSEIRAGKNTVLYHYKIQQESTKSYHVGKTSFRQDKNSQVESHNISLGGALVRNDIHSLLEGEGAGILLNGFYMGTDNQHVDNHTRVDHLEPHTSSQEIYRGVLNDHARGVFNGKVIVHKDAQKTDAMQSNANLLLSDNAEVDTKPELEIYADDVKCAHGSTVGQLDEDMLFYLRSRCIDENTARSLLTFAFAEEVIREIKLGPVRKRLEFLVIGRLPEADLIREFAK